MRQAGGAAWYAASRTEFLAQTASAIADNLTGRAVGDGWAIPPEQQEEWTTSVSLLQKRLSKGSHAVHTLFAALASSQASEVSDVVLEYNLRRRGLRVDAVLFAPGLLVVLEFKRSTLDATARDQVMGYCTNLLEFHQYTRELADQDVVLVPILVQTSGTGPVPEVPATRLRIPFGAVASAPIQCGPQTLGNALEHALSMRSNRAPVNRRRWLAADYSPSSTLVDAAISLWGAHEVSAIKAHAAPVKAMRACIDEVARHIAEVRAEGGRRVVFVSGAPGAGKTLVGLELAMSSEHRETGVFVTGNTPLVDVLEKALQRSYQSTKSSRGLIVASGYAASHVQSTIGNSTFKLVKAHRFLGDRGGLLGSTDGAVLVFDEAQRTYKKGRMVARHKLPDDEAKLVLRALADTHGKGLVVVALLGQNQAINQGERGGVAWLEAADNEGWTFAIDDRTLALPELAKETGWHTHKGRHKLHHGHLSHSLRYYRNAGLERWAHEVLAANVDAAREEAERLDQTGHTIWLTRSIHTAKQWVRGQRVGQERSGIIGSAQARRLAAHGLQVDQKPDIATWMLAPTGDFRSSNMLETVQNQYQIQGLELDWALVCWGADLRWTGTHWSAHKLSGPRWNHDKALHIAQNGYRVLLTRARKGMVVYVATGDASRIDPTRPPEHYDLTADFLVECGARLLPDSSPE